MKTGIGRRVTRAANAGGQLDDGNTPYWLNAGVKAHQSENLELAETWYRRILERVPGHADALHLLGVLRHQQGRDKEALRLIQRAIAAAPDHAHYHANLTDVYRALGRWHDARQSSERALTLNPNLPGLAGVHADVLLESGQAEAAVEVYRRAIAEQPDSASLRNSLGNALAALGRWAEAVTAYEQALNLDSGYRDALVNLARTLADTGQPANAVGRLESWLASHSGDHDLRRLLAALQRRAGQHHKALVTLEALASAQPDSLGIVFERGELLEELGRHAEALRVYEAAGRHESGADRARILARTGICHEQTGDATAAVGAYRQALAADPGCAAAWEGLCNVGAVTAEEMKGIRARLRDRRWPASKRAGLHFALGHHHERSADFARAFEQFKVGNRLVAWARRFDPAALTAYTDRLIETFDAGFFASIPRLESRSGPIFIVGMPRSGTTLAERILSAHPRVVAGGERREVPRLVGELEARAGAAAAFPAAMDACDRDLLCRLADSYRRWLGEAFPAHSGFFTDKLPSNYLRLGLIASILPGARIIHCRRNALDTCLSCYTTHFSRGQSFSYDLRHLGHAYREYRRLMTHWESVLPMPILDFLYEDLLDDPEDTARQLLAFCDLDWDARCLEFHRTDEPVRTASRWQVRQPLYKSSRGRWRHYEPHLGPLIKALGEYA